MFSHTALLPIDIAIFDNDPDNLMHQLAGEDDNEVVQSFADEHLNQF